MMMFPAILPWISVVVTGRRYSDEDRVRGEHFLRRPLNHIQTATDLDVELVQRFTLGLVERLVARKPEQYAATEAAPRG